MTTSSGRFAGSRASQRQQTICLRDKTISTCCLGARLGPSPRGIAPGNTPLGTTRSIAPVWSLGCAQKRWTPALSGGRRHVVALDAETGKIVWHDDLDPSDGDQQLFVAHGMLLVQTGSKIIALQSATGVMLWQRESQIQSWYYQAQHRLYTVSIDVPDPVLHPTAPIWSGLRASELTTGKQFWAIPQPLSVTGVSSIDANGILYADSAAITKWSLQGKQLWTHLYAGSPSRRLKPCHKRGLTCCLPKMEP